MNSKTLKKFIKSKNKLNKTKTLLFGKIKENKTINSVISPKFCPNKLNPKSNAVISLTTYASRYDSCIKTLKSLLLQSLMPKKIVCYTEEKRDTLTKELLDLEKYGIEFICEIENLKCHNKYYYAMQEYENDIVITVDDDKIYPRDFIKSLIKTHVKFPNCVVARRVHKINFNDDYSIKPYNRWFKCSDQISTPSHFLFATGVGGVLYPPNSLDKRVFDKENIKKYCLNADDVWLKFMELLNNTKVVFAKNDMINPPDCEKFQIESLKTINEGENKNDEYIENLFKLYGEEIKKALNS